ncbi:hypothetical protein Dshi_2553 [Dinoroseobacter shibae DFL 12 = DSM 16493]|jgi:hypothetical protein|uniref:Baseplate protein J-like domain-containing protein n=1 Tax=Dinoroseobacter shibae (strain DSM 16493 / NCIMB 14021 / DFL 12) TaxID=398580 RepID=A8LST7_DINSH|nr:MULTISPECIES: hypothetical protein [Dinoroseobacter]ABV94286.1 hypothetical protein Dshi_2553 [Dinoroseobacter shibae DFL 12 = DSM 16493]MDD9717750.1 hypothetical protein [Dinoroseobacter sp. PD6]URF45722.1 hypothetical protein M8008_13165 [Dinoroseobacter shibae]URF50027.1 hypothetical protein M8007_13165 [Dinoroseobacter shibae]
MADTPQSVLSFDAGCPDCGVRRVQLPDPLPPVGDDFDWLQRDYDGFRIAMMEELAARFPERRSWSPADLEVVLVEALSVVLDQLSDMLDRVHAEAFLETARRPDSVWRLLNFIGYDPLPGSGLAYDPDDAAQVAAAKAVLLDRWLTYPAEMAAAKIDGPRSIQRQRRMVTEADVVSQLEAHPLVERAHARMRWTGSWNTLRVACLTRENTPLDTPIGGIYGPASDETAALRAEIDGLHREAGIDLINWDAEPTLRSGLRELIDAYRMAGQEIWLEDPVEVPVLIDMTVLVRDNFYRSEMQAAVARALGTGLDGFFSPTRLRFGEDLHASDVIAAVMALDGVEAVCLNRFKRLGDRYSDQSESGRIELVEREIAICDNDPSMPGRGLLRLRTSGGLAG